MFKEAFQEEVRGKSCTEQQLHDTHAKTIFKTVTLYEFLTRQTFANNIIYISQISTHFNKKPHKVFF